MSSWQSFSSAPRVPRRNAARLRLDVPVRLRFVSRDSKASLKNISCTGAQIELDQPPRIGEFGELKFGDTVAFFEVIWLSGKCIGVEFDQPLPKQDVTALRQTQTRPERLHRQRLENEARKWVTGAIH